MAGERVSALSRGLARRDPFEEFIDWGQGQWDYEPPPHDDSDLAPNYVLEPCSPMDLSESASHSTTLAPPSFEYTPCGPPSILESPPSFDQASSWSSSAPSFSTTATSAPDVGENKSSFYGYYNAYEGLASAAQNTEWPEMPDEIIPQQIEAVSSGHANLLNPHLQGSRHAFNSLDVHASQALATHMDWAPQPPMVEPEMGVDYSQSIPIPSPAYQVYHGENSMQPWPAQAPQEYALPRGIAIPQPHRRFPACNDRSTSPHWNEEVPPILPVYPDTVRQHHDETMLRTSSGTESPHGRDSFVQTSSSPNNLSWISHKFDQSKQRLVPLGAQGTGSKQPKGRKGPLHPEGRTRTARVRKMGACSNCKKKKGKCDTGTPCKPCVEFFKADLVHQPCRGQRLSDLSKTFLSDRLSWHPTERAIETFIPRHDFEIHDDFTITIPVNFGFGPPLSLPVHALEARDWHPLIHDHIIYSWPPSEAVGGIHRHAVLPAVLTQAALMNLSATLDHHLSLLVNQHFQIFPLYKSPLRILRGIYVLYRSLPRENPQSRLLEQALKLMVLVHIGGDLTVSASASNALLAQLFQSSMSHRGNFDDNCIPTPCFIRSQFGSVMPSLAMSLMTEVLESVEPLMLGRERQAWPVVLATVLVVLMTIESIQYHDAKLPYHHAFDPQGAHNRNEKIKGRELDEAGIETLLHYYTLCFSGHHERLKSDWQDEATNLEAGLGEPEDRFIESVREAAKDSGTYINRRALEDQPEGDMGWFFDRLVARLLVLEPREPMT